MNSNIFERKSFIDGNYISGNNQDIFSSKIFKNRLVLKVNLLRATANETELFKNFLSKHSESINNSIILDLSNCNFVDSTFLSSIISFNKKYDVNMKLVVADTRQLTIFKITKLDSIFNIYTDIENAIAAYLR